MRSLPRLYAILDSSCFASAEEMLRAAAQWVAAGVTLLQYRDKSNDAPAILANAAALSEICAAANRRGSTQTTLIMNDRADLCLAASFEGVHVGQDDLSPASVRRIIGSQRWLGTSTHNPSQVSAADHTTADYIAIGPVFATSSKANPDPVVGLEGVCQARELTGKPLVAIGGINRRNCLSVIQAGADSVAVISDLVRDPGKSVEEFLSILG